MHRFLSCFLLGVLLVIIGSGCALRPPLLPDRLPQNDLPPATELKRVPFFPQKTHQCGPAALASLLAASGVPVTPEGLSEKVFLPGRKGSIPPEIMAACRRFGRMPYQIAPEFEAVIGELGQGRPVLVLTNLGIPLFPVWHYAVVIGYDLRDDSLLLRSGDTPREVVPAGVFFKTWNRAECWGIVALKPGELPFRANREAYLAAAADLEEVGRLREARKAYEAALHKWPDAPIALFGAGNTAYAMGDLEQAEAAFRRLLRLRPAHAAALNNLSVVLGDLGKYGEALDLLSEALASGSCETELRKTLIRTRATIIEKRNAASRQP